MNLKQIKKFLQSNIEEVLQKLDVSCEVFGDNIYSSCPIHESSDNPRAFSYSKNKNIWKCWTRECQEEYKNDVFGLILGVLSNRAGSKQTFANTLEWIRTEFNLKIDHHVAEENIEQIDKEMDFDTLVDCIKNKNECESINSYHLNVKIDVPSRYFMDRGFSAETLNQFGVGDCLDKNSKLYERAIIPIHSECGNQTIGYICRAIKEYKTPKFLIYPQGFDKRFVFYNMHRALPFIKSNNSVIIVEGQGDVWKLYESGIFNAVGMFGRTMTKEQQAKLQRLPITHVVILTDNDQAGREAKIQLQRQLGRFYRLSFPQLSQKDIGDMSINQIKSTILSQMKV